MIFQKNTVIEVFTPCYKLDIWDEKERNDIDEYEFPRLSNNVYIESFYVPIIVLGFYIY